MLHYRISWVTSHPQFTCTQMLPGADKRESQHDSIVPPKENGGCDSSG